MMLRSTERFCFDRARWIGPQQVQVDWRAPELPAPCFRREFTVNSCRDAELRICGLGFFVCRINGQRVGDQVLAPTVSIYDRHVRFLSFNVSELLHIGRNVITVTLGNGWYNPSTTEVWHLDKAVWRDYPKLLLQLDCGGKTAVASDETWRVTTAGPIRFNALRNGEFYDARLEQSRQDLTGFDDSCWENARRVAGPGGVLIPEIQPPCRITETLPLVRLSPELFDAGENLAGWCRLRVRGTAGARITLHYGESLDSRNRLDNAAIGMFVFSGEFQTDSYTLRGETCGEIWEPEFTYHGFRYVRLEIEGEAELLALEARRVGTDFQRIGNFHCSLPIVNELEAMALRSCRANFVGIPTDCPHREKNGWTGDALAAVETVLYHFDAARAYEGFLEILIDTQRPSGQLPGMAPTSGWGYNSGNGPAWDGALALIPELILRFNNDDRPLRKCRDAIRRYLDYCETMSSGDLVSFGLGDWCHVDKSRMAPVELTSSCFLHAILQTVAAFAARIGDPAEQTEYLARARRVAAAILRKYARPDGSFADGRMTSLATPVYFGIAPEPERTAALLDETVRANDYRIDFGFLGAKFVPRVLAEHGYVDTAFELLTQTKFPGWGYWAVRGETTFLEHWEGGDSRNHVLFADLSAWLFRYPAGFRHDAPGKLVIAPVLPKKLDSVRCDYRGCRSEWQRESDGNVRFRITIPPETRVRLELPGIPAQCVGPGEYEFSRESSES
ncbi:alpha-L-rhamnosidase [uncultured Victivallis sp.]|uniref:alpha-L-rhamnosidase n=1 Tax=uncultured Victivallis sp. TaxID=354118 RepID=UPI0025DAFE8E|nr:alpha-L-rhamnosidase [uncultured Victivallis sp.]